MPIIEFQEELPSSGPKFFKPSSYRGKKVRIAILDSKRKIATEIHWVEDDVGNRVPYECIHGDCCLAFGTPNQNYIIPVWVYDSPDDKSGVPMAWSLPTYKFSQFVTISEEYDLEAVDFIITFVKKGLGTDYTIVTSKASNLSSKDRDMIAKEVLTDFFAFTEKASRRDMTPSLYAELIDRQGLSDKISEMRSVQESTRQTPLALKSGTALKSYSSYSKADKPLARPARHVEAEQTDEESEKESEEMHEEEHGDEDKAPSSFDETELNALLHGKRK